MGGEGGGQCLANATQATLRPCLEIFQPSGRASQKIKLLYSRPQLPLADASAGIGLLAYNLAESIAQKNLEHQKQTLCNNC